MKEKLIKVLKKDALKGIQCWLLIIWISIACFLALLSLQEESSILLFVISGSMYYASFCYWKGRRFNEESKDG